MSPEPRRDQSTRTIEDLVFVAFNSRVAALDRYTGEIVWTWRSPKGSGYVSLLLDGDRLIAGVNGYIYCLDPIFGQEVWQNPMTGEGVGVTSIATHRGGSTPADPAAETARQQQAAAAAAAG